MRSRFNFRVNLILTAGARLRLYPAAAVLISICIFVASNERPSAQEASEYSVKAAFLYNFARYVDWPPEILNQGAFVIGILGDDPFGKELDQITAGKNIAGRPLYVRRLKRGEPLSGCRILFISNSEKARLSQILQTVRDVPILTVGEMDQFEQKGGIIRFVIENRRVRFLVNLNAAEQAHLKISSKLLSIAEVVRSR